MPVSDEELLTRVLPYVDRERRIGEITDVMRRFVELKDNPFESGYDLLRCRNPPYAQGFMFCYQRDGIDEAIAYIQRAFKYFGTSKVPGDPRPTIALPPPSVMVSSADQSVQSRHDPQDHRPDTERTLPPVSTIETNAASTSSTQAPEYLHNPSLLPSTPANQPSISRAQSPDLLRDLFGYQRRDPSTVPPSCRSGTSSYAWESSQGPFTAMRNTSYSVQAEPEVERIDSRYTASESAKPAEDVAAGGPVKAGKYWRCPHPWCIERGPDGTLGDCERHMRDEHGRRG